MSYLNIKGFPTIKQMEEGILFAMGGNNDKCEYHQDTHTFLATEMIPYPVRDSGGSIDSVDFQEVKHEITFKEAYDYWVAYMDFVNGVATPLPAPVSPYAAIADEEELPF